MICLVFAISIAEGMDKNQQVDSRFVHISLLNYYNEIMRYTYTHAYAYTYTYTHIHLHMRGGGHGYNHGYVHGYVRGYVHKRTIISPNV